MSNLSVNQDAAPDPKTEKQYTADEDEDPGMWAFPTIPLAVAIADLRRVGLCHRAVRSLQSRHWAGFEKREEIIGRTWLMLI